MARVLLSLAALTALAVTEIFDKHPDVDKCFGTSDGNLFLPSSLNAARNHARQEKLEVHEISRSGADSTDVLDHIETDAAANEKKQEAANAAAAANATKTAPLATGAAVSPESGALAQAKGKAKAEKAIGKSKDAPAKDGKATAPKKAAATKPAPAPAAEPAKDGAPAGDGEATKPE